MMSSGSGLGGRAYSKALRRLFRATAAEEEDFDEKAIKLLDHLQAATGQAREAVRHLEESLRDRRRQDVVNWHAYVYTLLRDFDEEAYLAMKAADGRRARRTLHPKLPTAQQEADAHGALSLKAPPEHRRLNPLARPFVPGRPWPECSEDAAQRPARPRPEAEEGTAAGGASPGAAEARQHPERTPEAKADDEGEQAFLDRPEEALAGKSPAPQRLEEEASAKAWAVSLQGAAALPAGTRCGSSVMAHAAAGALALGVGGGASGLAAGGVLGAACGLVPALFTFGLSVPLGAALGAGAGLCAGVTAGSTVGLAAGCLLGRCREARWGAAVEERR